MRKLVTATSLAGLIGAPLVAPMPIHAQAARIAPAAAPASCNAARIARIFAADPLTQVTLVRAFAKGDDLTLSGTPSGVIAQNDLCVVKLNVGPGNPGPAGEPSTSRGIGIELWLPAAPRWNGRIHNVGGSGFAGDPSVQSLLLLAGATSATPSLAEIAGIEGAVSGYTDAGRAGQGDSYRTTSFDGSYLMNPDGTINRTLWQDFSERSHHELAQKSKTLAEGYYGRAASFAYFDGCSTGGRQGHKSAQRYPDDYDGILVGNPPLNWTFPVTAALYPQIVFQRDLGGRPIPPAVLDFVSSAAISACDTDLNGEHMGYISDPARCRYNPATDEKVLCRADGGSNATALCITRRQAEAMNKIWYGPTADGHAPDPARDNGYTTRLGPDRIWFGVPRGVTLAGQGGFAGLAVSSDGVPRPFRTAAYQLALTMQDPGFAPPDFHNGSRNGADRWKTLSYADLTRVAAEGLRLQEAFSHINTYQTDLSAFRASKGKMLFYHGMADELLPVQGSIRYYEKVIEANGGLAAVQSFYRFYPIPGLAHCSGTSIDGVPGVSPKSSPPVPRPGQLYEALVTWVEKGVLPEIVLQDKAGLIARPLCAYPRKLRYLGGDRASAKSYDCS